MGTIVRQAAEIVAEHLHEQDRDGSERWSPLPTNRLKLRARPLRQRARTPAYGGEGRVSRRAPPSARATVVRTYAAILSARYPGTR